MKAKKVQNIQNILKGKDFDDIKFPRPTNIRTEPINLQIFLNDVNHKPYLVTLGKDDDFIVEKDYNWTLWLASINKVVGRSFEFYLYDLFELIETDKPLRKMNSLSINFNSEQIMKIYTYIKENHPDIFEDAHNPPVF